MTDVRGLADVDAVQLHARPRHEHLAPRGEPAGARRAALYAPRPGDKALIRMAGMQLLKLRAGSNNTVRRVILLSPGCKSHLILSSQICKSLLMIS